MDTKTISIKVEFTQDELKDIAMLIAEKVKEYYALEQEKKSVVSRYSSHLKEIREVIEKKGNELTLGYCYEERTCEVVNDYETNTRSYFDLATGDVVKVEPIDGEVSLFENISKVTASENGGPEETIFQSKDAM